MNCRVIFQYFQGSLNSIQVEQLKESKDSNVSLGMEKIKSYMNHNMRCGKFFAQCKFALSMGMLFLDAKIENLSCKIDKVLLSPTNPTIYVSQTVGKW